MIDLMTLPTIEFVVPPIPMTNVLYNMQDEFIVRLLLRRIFRIYHFAALFSTRSSFATFFASFKVFIGSWKNSLIEGKSGWGGTLFFNSNVSSSSTSRWLAFTTSIPLANDSIRCKMTPIFSIIKKLYIKKDLLINTTWQTYWNPFPGWWELTVMELISSLRLAAVLGVLLERTYCHPKHHCHHRRDLIFLKEYKKEMLHTTFETSFCTHITVLSRFHSCSGVAIFIWRLRRKQTADIESIRNRWQ